MKRSYSACLLFVANILLLADNYSNAFILNADSAIAVHEKCAEELKPPPEILEKFLHREYPDHESTNCFIRCLMYGMKMYNDSTGFHTEKIIMALSGPKGQYADATKKSLDKCFNKYPRGDDDSCTWVAKNFKCFLADNKSRIARVLDNRKATVSVSPSP